MDKSNLDLTRARLLSLHELLEAITFAKKQVSMSELKEYLAEKMELEEIDRRTIYRDILLINSISNINIAYDQKSRKYRTEFRQKLSDAELIIAVNAIISSKFNTADESDDFADKLYKIAGYPEKPKRAHKIKGRIKMGEGDILEKINFVQKAIENGMKICFDYHKYTLNKKFEIVRQNCLVSPYRILWQNDSLYLVGNFEGNDFSHYRFERLTNLREVNEKRKPISDIIGNRLFDEAEYLRQAVGLSRGVATRVVIKFKNEYLAEVFDNLGLNVVVKDNGDGTFTLDDTVLLNKKFTCWVLSFGDSAKVLKPDTLRTQISNTINSAKLMYDQ